MKIGMHTKTGPDKIRAELDKVQKRCTARTITYDHIVRYLERVEATLDIGKKALEGVRAECDPNSQHFPNAYKYTPESTHFSALYHSGHWYITDISRSRCWDSGVDTAVWHTDASKAALINRFTRF